MIELKNISYQIGGTTILDALNWKVEKGQHALMLGASGSGKTTLLHLLAGLLTPSGGTIEIDGQNIAALSGASLDSWRGRNIGMVFQTLHLVKALTVQDNLRLAQTMARMPADDARIAHLLDKLGLADKAAHYPHQLSVGQAALGASGFIVGKSLGHKSMQATAVYARLNLDPVRTSVNAAADAMFKAAKKKK